MLRRLSRLLCLPLIVLTTAAVYKNARDVAYYQGPTRGSWWMVHGNGCVCIVQEPNVGVYVAYYPDISRARQGKLPWAIGLWGYKVFQKGT